MVLFLEHLSVLLKFLYDQSLLLEWLRRLFLCEWMVTRIPQIVPEVLQHLTILLGAVFMIDQHVTCLACNVIGQ